MSALGFIAGTPPFSVVNKNIGLMQYAHDELANTIPNSLFMITFTLIMFNNKDFLERSVYTLPMNIVQIICIPEVGSRTSERGRVLIRQNNPKDEGGIYLLREVTSSQTLFDTLRWPY